MAALADIADVEEMEFPQFPYVEITSVILMVESANSFEDFLAEGRTAGAFGDGLARSQSLRPPRRAGYRLHQGPEAAGCDGEACGRGDVRLRCNRGPYRHEHGHAH